MLEENYSLASEAAGEENEDGARSEGCAEGGRSDSLAILLQSNVSKCHVELGTSAEAICNAAGADDAGRL